MQGRDDGFTIVEVSIFLAISGMLLLMVLIGTGTLAARQRFTNTTDGLQSYFQGQYDEVLNGVNIRSGESECPSESAVTPGKSQCLLLGKLITIDDGGMVLQSSYVVSTSVLSGAEDTDWEKLEGADLMVVATGQTSYELEWKASTYMATRSTSLPSGSGRGSVDSIAFLRVPDSNRIVQLYYNNSELTLDQGLKKMFSDNDMGAYNPPGDDTTNPSLAVCVENSADFYGPGSPRAAIIFRQGRGAGTITTNYEPGGLCS